MMNMLGGCVRVGYSMLGWHYRKGKGKGKGRDFPRPGQPGKTVGGGNTGKETGDGGSRGRDC